MPRLAGPVLSQRQADGTRHQDHPLLQRNVRACAMNMCLPLRSSSFVSIPYPIVSVSPCCLSHSVQNQGPHAHGCLHHAQWAALCGVFRFI